MSKEKEINEIKKENNEIKKGDKLLLTAIGSGWSWGSGLLNYED